MTDEPWQRPRDDEGNFIEPMSDNDTDDEDKPDAQTDEKLDDSITDSGGTTSSRARHWLTNDAVALAFAGTTCLLVLAFAILPAFGVKPAEPPWYVVALLGVGLFATLAWQYGVEALVAGIDAFVTAWDKVTGSGGDDE